LTVTLLEVVLVMPPPMAVTFRVKEPKSAFEAALRLRTEVPGRFSVWGLNWAVTPEGKAPTDNVTLVANPSKGAIETTNEDSSSGMSVKLLGWRVRVKSGAARARAAKAMLRALKTILTCVLMFLVILGRGARAPHLDKKKKAWRITIILIGGAGAARAGLYAPRPLRSRVMFP
jgi:hypothetical protein